ncbi:hypothetical protein LOTGIDRAFT_171994 [Lottia gigantea]|uniref:Uncharacterized protein n=1 Tax=Lottia gigantea TaxID=225164 RepID=V4B4W2_LOTGI|nr:hypothetical protein LOTGIDRAFT_171994 [Lottia gigantea]ESP02521.1 hypothetical protein LOTGIDRAFT_171994 [Lottia gigantea]
MGAKNCHHAETSSPKYRLFKGSRKKPAPPPDISESEVILLRNSWIRVKEEIEDIGVFTFIGGLGLTGLANCGENHHTISVNSANLLSFYGLEISWPKQLS